MYKKILVAVEPTHAEKHEKALKLALRLAEDVNSEVTALTVIEPLPNYLGPSETNRKLEANAGEAAMSALRRFVGPPSEIRTLILYGSAGAEILKYAKEKHVDCIVIASHKPGLSDYLLGSTAARVVRHASCSVHVLR